MSICKMLFFLLRCLFVSRSNLILENLALRQQLTVQQRTIKRPKLKNKDRILWSWLSQIWPDWKSNLIIVKPETVIKWHRQGFKLYWRWKSRTNKVRRPKISKEIRDLIRQMSRENQTWGAPRIQSELKLLGYEVADSTVAKYMIEYIYDCLLPNIPIELFLNHYAESLHKPLALNMFIILNKTPAK